MQWRQAAVLKAASPYPATTPAPVVASSTRPPAADVMASAGKAIRRFTAGAAAVWAGMSGSQKSATMAAVLIVGGVAGGAFRGDFWAQLAFLVGMVLLVPTILLTSREGPRMAGLRPLWGCAFTDPEGRFCRLQSGHGGPHEADPGDVGLANGPATLIRTYAARSNQEAVMAFQADAASLAQHGYEPTSQSWAEDQRGPTAGSVVRWGAFAASKRRGGGTLTVTYRRVPQPQPVQQAQVSPAPPAAPTIPDQIRGLGELRDQGLLTSDEFEEKKRELLSRM